jgi:UDP-2,3-diacylglucosamine hydrolase
MSHKVTLQKGALIISDAHYSVTRPELLHLIEAIASKQIIASQLILMGDIFDNLFGSIEYTYENNQKMIQLLDYIAQEIEVIYLEGNHDFHLCAVFKNIKIFPIQTQPIEAQYGDKTLLLAHGDFDGALGYKIYTALIRNPTILYILRFIDNNTNHSIINFVQRHLDKKDDCKEFTGFREYIQNRIVAHFRCDFFIEGHYHQNKNLEFQSLNYINLGAFACNQRYFIVKSFQDKELLEEKIFSKGI